MTPPELKKTLAANGFYFGFDGLRDTGVDWYAWRRLPKAADCACNDKPPSLLVYPHHLHIDGQDWYSTEFVITGEIESGLWVTSKIYSVKMDEAITRLPKIEATLTKVWNAAAGVTP